MAAPSTTPLQGICEGVAAFHEHDPPWAHRDIKPANVLLDEDDHPVLMDFGSVTEAHQFEKNSRKTGDCPRVQYCVPKKEIIGLSRKRSNDSSAAQRARSAALAT